MDPMKEMYKIPADYEAIFESEESDAQRIHPDPLPVKIDVAPELIEYRANQVQRLSAILEGVKAKYKPIQDAIEGEIKDIENRIAHHKHVIQLMLPPSEESQFFGEAVSLYYSASKSVEVEDVQALPGQYQKMSIVPCKAELLRDLKLGKDIPGATLKSSYNLKFSAGGEKGKKLAEKRSIKKMDE